MTWVQEDRSEEAKKRKKEAAEVFQDSEKELFLTHVLVLGQALFGLGELVALRLLGHVVILVVGGHSGERKGGLAGWRGGDDSGGGGGQKKMRMVDIRQLGGQRRRERESTVKRGKLAVMSLCLVFQVRDVLGAGRVYPSSKG